MLDLIEDLNLQDLMTLLVMVETFHSSNDL